MMRARRTFFLAAPAMLLVAGLAQAQGPFPPLMQAAPKPAVANARPVQSCESLASTDDAANFVCCSGF